MVTIKQIEKEKPNYWDCPLYEIYGFALRDHTICLNDEAYDGVFWINDDGVIFINIHSKYKNKYKNPCDPTIGDFLQAIEDTFEPDDVSAIFRSPDDIKITFEYVVNR